MSVCGGVPTPDILPSKLAGQGGSAYGTTPGFSATQRTEAAGKCEERDMTGSQGIWSLCQVQKQKLCDLVRFLDFAGDAASQHFYCPSGPVEVDNGRQCGKITNSRKISQDSDGCHWMCKDWVCKVHACSATDLLRDLGEVTCPVWVSASSLTAGGTRQQLRLWESRM